MDAKQLFKLNVVIFLLFFWWQPAPVFSKEIKTSDKVNVGTGVTETHTLTPFETIELSGMGDLYITQSATQSFSIDADVSVLPLITVSVVNKILKIDMKNASEHTRAKIKYNLSIKDVKQISSFGSSTVYIEDGYNAPVLTLLINNLGEAYIKKINVGKLNVKINGGGNVEVTGVADQQNIYINGAGAVNFSKLSGQKSTITIFESGEVKTSALDLEVTIPRQGVLKYCGKPNFSKKDVTTDAIISPLPIEDCKP